MFSGRRRQMVAAAVIAASLVPATAASASFSGTDPLQSQLTAANGSTAIQIQGHPDLQPTAFHGGSYVPAVVTDLSWAPDGSRAVFVNQFGEIETIRSDGTDQWSLANPLPGTLQRREPVFDASGQFVVYAEKNGANPWYLVEVWATSAMAGDGGSVIGDYLNGFADTHPESGPAGIAYQRQPETNGTPTGTPEVWLYQFATGSATKIVGNASDPSLNPRAPQVAFVRSDGGHQQIWTSDLQGGNVIKLTSDATDKADPAYSNDGTTVSFSVAGGGIASVPVGGGMSTPVAGMTGIPAYQPIVVDRAIRLGGADRYGTAINVSKARWAGGAAQSVVLSRSDNFADALAGSNLSVAKHGPLLLTSPGSLNAATATEISRVLGANSGKTVYILGGTSAISAAVQASVASLGYTIKRLEGADRFGTALAIANEITSGTPGPELILAANGLDFPDALVAGATAGAGTTYGWRAVVVLTKGTTLDPATKAYLDSAQTDSWLAAVGAPAVTATAAYPNADSPPPGADQYETARNAADFFLPATAYAAVATGENWPDALAGGAFIGGFGGPLLYTRGTTAQLDPNTRWALSDRSAGVSAGVVFGGPAVVTDAQLVQVGAAIGSAYTTVENPVGLSTPPGPSMTSRSSLSRPKSAIRPHALL